MKGEHFSGFPKTDFEKWRGIVQASGASIESTMRPHLMRRNVRS